MLEAFGVRPATEDVYRAVLQDPAASPEALAELLDTPLEAVSGSLAELADLGLVADEGTRVLAPDRALEVLIAREEEALEARRERLAASRQAIPELVHDYVEHRRSFVSDRVELLTDSALVRARLFQLTSEARTSAWAMSPGPGLSPGAIEAALPLDRELIERGVDARMIVSTTSTGVPHWDRYLADLVDLGHKIRSSTTMTQRAIVVDGMTGVIPWSDRDRRGAYVLHGGSLVAPLVSLFEELWLGAEQLDVDAVGAGTVPDAKVREVAALLARGLKDDAVARRLGVSVRTVRRLIATTVETLQADSRFQAGAEAARRGWLD